MRAHGEGQCKYWPIIIVCPFCPKGAQRQIGASQLTWSIIAQTWNTFYMDRDRLEPFKSNFNNFQLLSLQEYTRQQCKDLLSIRSPTPTLSNGKVIALAGNDFTSFDSVHFHSRSLAQYKPGFKVWVHNHSISIIEHRENGRRNSKNVIKTHPGPGHGHKPAEKWWRRFIIKKDLPHWPRLRIQTQCPNGRGQSVDSMQSTTATTTTFNRNCYSAFIIIALREWGEKLLDFKGKATPILKSKQSNQAKGQWNLYSFLLLKLIFCCWCWRNHIF